MRDLIYREGSEGREEEGRHHIETHIMGEGEGGGPEGEYMVTFYIPRPSALPLL